MSAPKDYTELFVTYYDYVCRLVRSKGIEESRKEDVASEILLRFYERGFLEKFDPSLTFMYGGEERPARFKSFLSKFVLTYVKGQREKQMRNRSREVLIADAPVGDGSGSRWIDVFGEVENDHQDDVLDSVTEQQIAAEVRSFLASVPRRSEADTCDLVALWDEIVRQVREHGAYNVNDLRRHFSVSSTAMHSWLWWLRDNLCLATGRELTAKRPRTSKKDWQAQITEALRQFSPA